MDSIQQKIECTNLASSIPSYLGGEKTLQSDVNKVVMLTTSEKEDELEVHRWNNQLPDSWVPSNSSEVSIIVCISAYNYEVLGQCEYNQQIFPGQIGSKTHRIERRHRSFDIYVIDRFTGEVLKENTWPGGEPPECPNSVTSLDPLYGARGDPPLSELIEFLGPFVETAQN